MRHYIEQVEEGSDLTPTFDEHFTSGGVLMHAYMNADVLPPQTSFKTAPARNNGHRLF